MPERSAKKRGPKFRYTEDFKRTAVEKAATATLKQVAQEMGVSVMSLVQWKKLYGAGQKRTATATPGVVESESALLMKLRWELQKVTEERDRLRKSLAILAGGGE